MASKGANKRLTKEYVAMQREPPPYIFAKPSESNILEWHYVIRGPSDTPYANGEYHGTLTFAHDYPFKPPAIRMITPSGRFQTNTRLCLSMSDFHPGTWNPSWSVATILNGLLSFMVGDESTTGSIRTPDSDKRIYAGRSHEYNLANKKFRENYPELCTPTPTDLPNMGLSAKSLSSTPSPTEIKPSITAAKNPPLRVAPAAVAPKADQRPLVNSTNAGAVSSAAAAGNGGARPHSPMAGLYKWAIFVVVCGYLVIAKLVYRGDSIQYPHS